MVASLEAVVQTVVQAAGQAVVQAVVVLPRELVEQRRKPLEDFDSMQQRRQPQREGVHLQEKSSAEPSLAVDIAPCPKHPSDLVDAPTGPGLLDRTLDHRLRLRAMLSPHSAMFLRPAHSVHSLHN